MTMHSLVYSIEQQKTRAAVLEEILRLCGEVLNDLRVDLDDELDAMRRVVERRLYTTLLIEDRLTAQLRESRELGAN